MTISNRARLLGTTLITSLALGLAVTPSSALAQEGQEASQVDEIVVTGSRIRRSPANSPTPLIQVTQEDLLQSGEVNVIDFLADIPALSGSIVPEDTTGANLNDGGLSLLGLRNLGAVRTLTLVDGRRHVGSVPGSLSVDVDTIPRLLIENVEVITGGAAAVYGADAVSGVVNFVLKKDFDGLEIDGSIAEINQDHQLSERLSIIWGQNLLDGRLNYYVSGEYNANEEVLDADVDWRRESWGFLGNDLDPAATPNDGVPDLVLVRDIRTYIRGTNFGGVTILATGVQPSPSSDPDIPFATCPTTSFSANCFSLAPTNNPNNSYLYTDTGASQPVVFGPIRSQTGFTRVASNGGLGQNQNTEQGQASRIGESEAYRFQTGLNFEITDNISLFAEAKYVEEETYDAGQRVFHDFNIRSFAPGTVGAITATTAFEIGLDNAYLPANVRTAIQNNVRQVYNSAGVLTGTVADPRAQHKLYGPARNQTNTRELQRYVIGLRGDAGDVGFVRNVSWEAGYTYGEMNNQNVELGVDIVRYQAAVDAVVDAAGIVNGRPGEVVCRVQLLRAQGIAVPDATLAGVTYSRQGEVISGCRPVRVFGEGGFSQEALNYLQASITVEDQNKQHDFLAFASGELWDFWGAGPIGASIGYEYRKEITSGVGRDTGTAGRLLFLNTGPDFAEASYDTNDVFAELSIPLMRDTFLGKSAEISGAYRYSDYSNVGEQDTYSAQFQWRLNDELMVRATTATAIRVPNLSETNEPYGQTFQNGFVDPCSATVINNLADQTIRTNRIANCATLASAAGLNLTFNSTAATNSYLPNYGSGSVPGLAGGNPFLQPETSESFTYGFVWSPDYLLPNLSIVMDYYDIRIEDAIASVSAQNAANQCVSGDQVNTGACATITRDPTNFQVTSFIQGSLNYAALTARGVDFTTRWGGDVFRFFGRDWGSFSHSVRGNWLIEQHDFVNIVDPTDSTDFEDTVGLPRVRFLSTLSWSPTPELSFVWDWDWQASQEIEDVDVIGNGNFDRYEDTRYLETGDYSQHDFSLRWQVREDLVLRAGVVNAFDADPARWLGNTSADNFDLFGRRFYLSFNFKPF